MNYDWNTMDKNLIVQIALELNIPDILSLCQTNKRFNLSVCESDIFWRKKLEKDFGIKSDNPKKKYQKIRKRINLYFDFMSHSAGPVFENFVNMGLVKRRFMKDLKSFLKDLDEESKSLLRYNIKEEYDKYVFYDEVLEDLKHEISNNFYDLFDKYMASYEWADQYNVLFKIIIEIFKENDDDDDNSFEISTEESESPLL